MTGDVELLGAFERATPDALDRFGHREHLRIAWLYLRREPLLGALARFCADLKRFANAAGTPAKYHETLTVAYLLLVHERMAAGAPASSSEGFLHANADLLAWPDGPVQHYYSVDDLARPESRNGFILPARPASA